MCVYWSEWSVVCISLSIRSELLIINWVLTAYPVCMYRPDKQLGSRDLYIQYTRLAVLAAEWPLDARPFEEWPQITPTLNGNRPTGLLYGRLITEFLKIRLYCWKNFFYIVNVLWLHDIIHQKNLRRDVNLFLKSWWLDGV